MASVDRSLLRVHAAADADELSDLSDGHPRASNTGVLTADGRVTRADPHGDALPRAREAARPARPPVRVLLDWLQWHEHDVGPRELQDWLGGPEAEWVELPRNPIPGYGSAAVWGDVMVAWDGRDGMGTQVLMPGAGCRQFEAHGRELLEVLARVVAGMARSVRVLVPGQGVKSVPACGFARLDVAFDDFGDVTVPLLQQAQRDGRVVARWRKGRDERSFDVQRPGLRDGPADAQTIEFGSRKSRLRLVAYDKREEQRSHGVEVAFNAWTRLEVRARDARADALARHVLHEGVGAALSVLAGYIDVKRRTADGDVDRWPRELWWDRFLQGASKVRLSSAPDERSFDDLSRWVHYQAGPSLAAIHEAGGVRAVMDAVRAGIPRMGPKHRRLAAEGRVLYRTEVT